MTSQVMGKYERFSPDKQDIDNGSDVDDSASSDADIGELVDENCGHDVSTEFEQTTEQQIQQAIESLQHIEGLDPQMWQTLDATERLGVLQNVEDRMADIQGRPAVEIVSEEMNPTTFGGYDGQRITLNSGQLESDMPMEEFIDTVVHEGRHVYQDYAVQNPGFVTDTALVNAWADNLANYLTAEEYGQELYVVQPIEADAWCYADRITSALIAGRLEK